jgi:Cu/Zn superoxide dismutase
MKRRRILWMVVAAVVATATVMVATGTSQAKPVVARATLVDINGNEVGEVEFTPRRDGSLLARAKLAIDNAITVNPSDFHGFHIHANNDDDTGDGNTNDGCITYSVETTPAPSLWFTQVDSHWDDATHSHGAHTGDLPSLLRQSDGEAEMTFVVDKFAAGQLPGTALIVHFLADDFGKHAGVGTSTTTGNAGSRYACGLIEAVATD